MQESLNTIINLFSDNADEDIAYVIQKLQSRLEGSSIVLVPTGLHTTKKIDIRKVAYLSQPKKLSGTVHFADGEEFSVEGFDLLAYIETHFDNFKILDHMKGLIVNMDLVIKYHSFMNKVYFANDDFVQVTSAAMKNVQKRFEALYDKERDMYYTNNEEEAKGTYAPKGKRFKERFGFN